MQNFNNSLKFNEQMFFFNNDFFSYMYITCTHDKGILKH